MVSLHLKEEGARIANNNITSTTKCAQIPTANVHWDNPGKDVLNINLKYVTSEKVLSTNQNCIWGKGQQGGRKPMALFWGCSSVIIWFSSMLKYLNCLVNFKCYEQC